MGYGSAVFHAEMKDRFPFGKKDEWEFRSRDRDGGEERKACIHGALNVFVPD
jgi:hypothetical protein